LYRIYLLREEAGKNFGLDRPTDRYNLQDGPLRTTAHTHVGLLSRKNLPQPPCSRHTPSSCLLFPQKKKQVLASSLILIIISVIEFDIRKFLNYALSRFLMSVAQVQRAVHSATPGSKLGVHRISVQLHGNEEQSSPVQKKNKHHRGPACLH
jgi:hypothetical protein